MFEFAIAWDWLEFALRWLHVITAIAWIGSSFYFIALDLGLRKDVKLPKGAAGEEWQVHGGGFYHIQKYLVAPAQDAGASGLVQVGILHDLDFRVRGYVCGLLRKRRTVPD